MKVIDKSEKLEELRKLVNKFRNNISQFTNKDYKEYRLRQDFVNEFFALLDWDMSNKAGLMENLREVVMEDNLEVSGTQKYPDYTFKWGDHAFFFVETKKPSIDIKNDIDPAFQVRRYGYSAKLKISILTDFHEFAIYDTRIKPNKNDKAITARLKYFTYEQYEENWDYLYGLLAKGNVISGSIEKEIGSGTKKGTSEVDKDFLELIEGWRSELAKSIARNNKKADLDSINMAVQKIIDRIIFLRICEEKGIEQYENLLNICKNEKNIYGQLAGYFDKANKKYNSELFKPDSFINELKIDNEVLADIIDGLYYPCPYAFSVLPVEILGNIYEQFLGKTIHLTETHQARIEEKPEVRKAGGVYYTPKYIVDYIVMNTVGEKIKGLTPKEIEKIKILDRACGSGSFLLGAYTSLLNYHLACYTKKENLAKALKNEAIYPFKKDSYKLTIKEKQKILLSNVFGVDIDAQAVEVTKLSLMLKLLEGEGDESAGKLFKYSDTKLLPTLSGNIKCGNSLVGPDFYKNKNLTLFGSEDMKKINAFDWQKEFPEILKVGGFDCVIGNPPYVRQESISQFKEYFERNYAVFLGTADLYTYFIEKGINLLKRQGIFSFIVANKWMRANYGENLRKFIVKNTAVREIIDFGELPVFLNAATFPEIIVLEKSDVKEQRFKYLAVKSLDFTSLFDEVHKKAKALNSKSLGSGGWTLSSNEEIDLLEKMKRKGLLLGDYVNNKIYRGLITGLNEAFVIDGNLRKKLIAEDKGSSELIKPFVKGDDIRKYYIKDKDRFLIFIPDGWTKEQSKGNEDPWKWFKENYPAIAKHLEIYETKAKQRWDKGSNWWELRPCDYYSKFEEVKILYPDIAKESRFTLDRNGTYSTNTAYFIPTNDLSLLAILNSKLIFYFFKKIAAVLGDADKGGRLRWFTQDIVKIPIAKVSNENRKQIESLVNQMLEIQQKSQSNKVEADKKHYQQKVELLDKQIDELIYEIYGLTKEEIAVVEGKL